MLEAYDIYSPAREIERFVEDLSNWYVRRNRRRFWKSENDAGKQAAYLTLHTCLTTLASLLAPFIPFISEAMYRNLAAKHNPTPPEAVTITSWHDALPTLLHSQR